MSENMVSLLRMGTKEMLKLGGDEAVHRTSVGGKRRWGWVSAFEAEDEVHGESSTEPQRPAKVVSVGVADEGEDDEPGGGELVVGDKIVDPTFLSHTRACPQASSINGRPGIQSCSQDSSASRRSPPKIRKLSCVFLG